MVIFNLFSVKNTPKPKVVLIGLSILIAITSAPTTYAVSPFMKENAYVYNPDSIQSRCSVVQGAAGSASPAILGNTNAEKIFNYLTGRGLSQEAAGGVLGNIAVESGNTLSPFIQEYAATWPKGGYGLVQWTADRRRAIESAMATSLPLYMQYYSPKYTKADKTTGLPSALSPEEGQRVNDALLQFQLDYLYQESTTRRVRKGYGPSGATEWEALLAAKTVKAASDIWLFSFERPRDQGSGQANNRAQLGQTWLDTVKKSGNIAAPSNPTTPVATVGALDSNGCTVEQIGDYSGSEQDLQQLTLMYAEPSYHRKPYLTKKPAYETAINKAKSSGGYTGDPCYGGGVDCGAFTTRLVIDSGWDPNFNYAGKVSKGAGNTTSQKKWMKDNWDVVGTGKVDTSLLKPGDVAIVPGHTFIFVGNIQGFDKQVASASQCGRSPMAGSELDMSASGYSGYTWYRKRGGVAPDAT